MRIERRLENLAKQLMVDRSKPAAIKVIFFGEMYAFSPQRAAALVRNRREQGRNEAADEDQRFFEMRAKPPAPGVPPREKDVRWVAEFHEALQDVAEPLGGSDAV